MSTVATARRGATTVTIIIPGEPKGKGRPRFFKGRAVTPTNTRDYERAIAWAALDAARSHGRFADTAPLRMTVLARVAIPESWSEKKRREAASGVIWPTGRPDGDNILKIAADSLNGVLYRDDAQLVVQTITKIYHLEPALVIEVGPV